MGIVQVENERVLSIQDIDISREFVVDNNLINEMEATGKQWTITLYTDQLLKWKDEWKRRKAIFIEHTAESPIHKRTEKDRLFTEGSIKITETLLSMDKVSDMSAHLNGPMNSDWDNDGNLVVPCSQAIRVIDPVTRKITKTISNRLFNDLHSVSVNKVTGKILVTSPGPGKILEVDPVTGNIDWEWDADKFVIKHKGIEESILKARNEYFAEDVDYRTLKIETSGQATHVNTATWIDDRKFGVSLFHQGTILVVDRHTGQSSVVLENLKKPHGFQPIDLGNDHRFIVTDTGNGAVWLLNKDLQPNLRLYGFFKNHPQNEISWLHTTFSCGDKLIALDQTQGEFVLLDPQGKRKQVIQHNPNWKVSYISRN